MVAWATEGATTRYALVVAGPRVVKRPWGRSPLASFTDNRVNDKWDAVYVKVFDKPLFNEFVHSPTRDPLFFGGVRRCQKCGKVKLDWFQLLSPLRPCRQTRRNTNP